MSVSRVHPDLRSEVPNELLAHLPCPGKPWRVRYGSADVDTQPAALELTADTHQGSPSLLRDQHRASRYGQFTLSIRGWPAHR